LGLFRRHFGIPSEAKILTNHSHFGLFHNGTADDDLGMSFNNFRLKIRQSTLWFSLAGGATAENDRVFFEDFYNLWGNGRGTG